MRRAISTIVVASAAALAACTPQPAQYAQKLSMNDPKWESEDCKEIRLASLNYDDKVGQRMAIGVASGLLLGPFGIPLAIAADANQEEQRQAFAREMHLRCSSLPLPESLVEKPVRAEPRRPGADR
ncbi:hypothetical protein [Hoeflea sp.]|uniref:hypothetical protein n=1 Tax=Hoeflea sp. TaxID=1940281 RepID=UPI003BB16790